MEEVTYRDFYNLETTHGNRCVAVSGFDSTMRVEFDPKDPRSRKEAIARVIQLNTQIMDFLGHRGVAIWKMQIRQIKGHFEDFKQEFYNRSKK